MGDAQRALTPRQIIVQQKQKKQIVASSVWFLDMTTKIFTMFGSKVILRKLPTKSGKRLTLKAITATAR